MCNKVRSPNMCKNGKSPELKAIRKQICRKVALQLRQADPSLDKAVVKRLALCFEKKLFQNAPTFECYTDVKTLKDRVRLLASHALVRKGIALKQQKCQPNTLCSEDGDRNRTNTNNIVYESRQDAVRRAAGDELFEKIKALIDEIRKIRLTNTIWSKTPERHAAAATATTTTSAGAAAATTTTTPAESQEASSVVCPEINAIYFATRLMQVGYVPLSHIPSIPWEEYVKEADENIAAFRKMERAVIAANPDVVRQPICCGSGGVCPIFF